MAGKRLVILNKLIIKGFVTRGTWTSIYRSIVLIANWYLPHRDIQQIVNHVEYD